METGKESVTSLVGRGMPQNNQMSIPATTPQKTTALRFLFCVSQLLKRLLAVVVFDLPFATLNYINSAGVMSPTCELLLIVLAVKYLRIILLAVLVVGGIWLIGARILNPPNITEVQPSVTPTSRSVQVPADLPTYPDSTLVSAYETKQSGSGISMLYSSPDEMEVVINYFEDGLQQHGWVVTRGTETSTLAFSKDETNGLIAFTQDENGNVLISITIGGALNSPTL